MGSGITRAVDDLAHTLGAYVDWQVLGQHLDSQPVRLLITLASAASYSASAWDRQQAAIGELLDTAAGQAGLDADQQTIAAGLAGLSLDLDEQRRTAVEQARELLGPLTALGVLQALPA